MPYVFLLRTHDSQWEYVDWTEWDYAEQGDIMAPTGMKNVGQVVRRHADRQSQTYNITICYSGNQEVSIIVYTRSGDIPASCYDYAHYCAYYDVAFYAYRRVRYPPPGLPLTEWRCPFYVGNLDIGIVPITIAENVFGQAPPLFCDDIRDICMISRHEHDTDTCIAVIPYAGYDVGRLAQNVVSVKGVLGRSAPTNYYDESYILHVHQTAEQFGVTQYDWIYVWVETKPKLWVRGLYESEIWRPEVISLICPGIIS